MELPLELLLTVALSFLMAIFFRKIVPVSYSDGKDPGAQFRAHKIEGEAEVISELFECTRTRLEESIHMKDQDSTEAVKGIREVIAENSENKNPDSSTTEEENSEISRHEEESAIEAQTNSFEGTIDSVESMLQEDDDWEGIERSDDEKLFAAAVEYVGSAGGNKAFSELSNDQQMQLLGLHKIATEGPCNESQPMAFKASARAKWHAWQKLGRMNPEEAMEKYVALLSDSIPSWKTQRQGKEDNQLREEIHDPELRT